jgi:glycosyltransferase involved in cell wall biosynthesis
MMNNYICSVVIPAYNEEKTVRKVVKIALQTEGVTEVVVVNDGSIDNTRKNIADLPIRIIDHTKNLGYTRAMHDGIKAAKGPIVAVIDADWKNITSGAIKKIIDPVINGEADLVKASFNMARGRVTEFAVKPMMKILFPDLEMNQPISGQFASHKSFLIDVTSDNSWGIAIGILIEAINAGLRVMEVEIGELVHKARTNEEKALMAKEVLETMIKKAGLIQHKYKLILFTLDKAVLKQTAMRKIYEKLQVYEDITVLQKKLAVNKISFETFITKSALLFKGKTIKEVEEAALSMPVQRYSQEVVKALKTRRYRVALISMNFSPIVRTVASKIGITDVDCISLEAKDGVLTGKVVASSANKWFSTNAPNEIFRKVFKSVLKKEKVKPSEVAMVFNSLSWRAILTKVGMSIAYKPESREVKDIADKTISILPEILAIVE